MLLFSEILVEIRDISKITWKTVLLRIESAAGLNYEILDRQRQDSMVIEPQLILLLLGNLCQLCSVLKRNSKPVEDFHNSKEPMLTYAEKIGLADAVSWPVAKRLGTTCSAGE